MTDIRTQLTETLNSQSDAQNTATLFAFMKERGKSNYDESVTQLEHGLQCADLAKQRGLSEAAITAALFHDIGHLLLDEHDDKSDFLAEDMAHEVAGGDFLQAWFPIEVTEPIRLHVAAKRYLCSTESAYYDQLSEASKRSFQVQGGKLSPEELAEFQKNEHLDIAVQLRRMDDDSKVQNKEVPEIDAYADIVTRSFRS